MLVGKRVGNIKKDGTGYHRISDNSIAGHLYSIAIQDMLKGVNNAQGKPYFQDKSAEVVFV